MQARLANRLKDLSELKKITKLLSSLNQEKASIAMQWYIKHLLIAEEWEEAYKTIKRLKKSSWTGSNKATGSNVHLRTKK